MATSIANQMKNLDYHVKLCKELTQSSKQYITDSLLVLQSMIDSSYGEPSPERMQLCYSHLKNLCEEPPQWFSQLGQDTVVACLLDFKSNGYFIEIGCGNGLAISNTYSLESFLNWRGLLVEPNKLYCEDMRLSRSSTIVQYAITDDPSKTELTLTSGNVFGSCQEDVTDNAHAKFLIACRNLGIKQKVRTIDAKSLCSEYNVPRFFEYLSLDIEGGELGIIMDWPFDRHRPLVLSVEHNYGASREKLLDYLAGLGYSSFGLGWDDVFIANELLDLMLSNINPLQQDKMNSQPPSYPADQITSSSCFRSRLLASNWALRDQLTREIQRMKDDSLEMISKTNQQLVTLEEELEKLQTKTYQQIVTLEEELEELRIRSMRKPHLLRQLYSKFWEKIKRIIGKNSNVLDQ